MHRFPLEIPKDRLSFDCFYLFALDFGIVPRNAQPKEVKNTLVIMDKYDLKSEKDFKNLDIEGFTEAIFVLAYAKVLLPDLSTRARGVLPKGSKF